MSTNPLLPESAIKYFDDAKNIQLNEYLRAYSLRNCLENIVNTIFIYLTNRESKTKWIENTTLNEKIKLSKEYFTDSDVFDKLMHIKNIGNKGHPDTQDHQNLTHEEINLALQDISKICEWVIITYLQKYGFNTNSWIPTMLSTLPPIYRINILENLFHFYKTKDLIDPEEIFNYLEMIHKHDELFMSGNISYDKYKNYTPHTKQKEFSQILLIVDKLAMAYLKNGEYDKSMNFIKQEYDTKIINNLFYIQMRDKLQLLENERQHLPISSSLMETKQYFKDILSVVKEDEYSLFITLFTAIIAQNEITHIH